MSASAVKTSAKWFGIIACGALGAFFSGYTATMGAMTTGLREGGWNWQFIPFVFGGWFFGSLIALISVFAFGTRMRSTLFQCLMPLVVPPAAAFIGGGISFPIMVMAGKAEARRSQQTFEASKAEYDAFYQQLRRDPEIALREEWYADYGERGRAFRDSLKDATVPYTSNLLKRFYVEAPVTRDIIFVHPACEAGFLSEHFPEAYERARSINYEMLASIVSNPNTPRELVERVVASRNTLPRGAVEPAMRAIGQKYN